MAYEPKDNTGTAFLNEKKAELLKAEDVRADKQPDYKGKALIDGKEYWQSIWIKTSIKTGQKFLSQSFTPIDEAKEKGYVPKETDEPISLGDIPF